MTGRYGCALTVLATLAISTGARAQETAPVTPESHEQKLAGPVRQRGLEMGVRLGFQAGLGYIYKNGHSANGETHDLKLTDASNGAIPGQIEVGYRVNPHLHLGVYAQYAFVFVKENPVSCPTDFDCSAWQWDLGPQAIYRFSPGAKFEPWVGLGVGVQILRSHVSGTVQIPLPTGGTVPADTEAWVTDRGPELNLGVGGDWRMGEYFRLGPFLNVTLARYTVHVGEQTVTLPVVGAQTMPVSPVDDGNHAVLTVGGRLSFF